MPSSSPRCLLVGNYGVGNIGDEALREFFLQEFPAVRWTVCTATGRGNGEVPRLPCGLRSLVRPWWRTLVALFRSDYLVFGGGTLLTDVESVRACYLWGLHALVAHLLGTPYILAFQGIGPCQSRSARRITSWVVVHARHVSVRDDISAERVRALGRHDVVIASDPAFRRFTQVATPPSSGMVLGVIPRLPLPKGWDALLRQTIDGASWSAIRIILMHPSDAECAVASDIARAFPQCVCDILPMTSVQGFLDVTSACSRIVSARYHGGIAAIALGIPFLAVPQAPGDKLSTLASIRRADALRAVSRGMHALETWLAER